MTMLILLTLLQIVSSNVAYNFTCPSSAHWKIRAKSLCEPPRNYTCLFDVTYRVNVYRERCSRPRILAEGYKYVFQPNLNRATCSVTRYQPFIFDTIGHSDCTFQKTPCNSLGQETYEDGNTTVNRKCICNTDRGYTFVMNSANQCYCDPTTEDCSCYLGINQYNKTVGMKDIECQDGMQMTRSRYLGDRVNLSRTIQIFEFDNYRYNINYAPTNEYRTRAATWVMILLFVYFVVLIIIVGIERRWIKNRSKNILAFKKLMQKSETEKRYFVRIMIVGKESAGKTCLLRRLLKEDIDDVTSTDGVDIVVRRCKINIEDGKWTIDKEIDDKKERMDRALSPNRKTKIDDIESTKRTKVSTKLTQSENRENNVLAIKSNNVNNGYPMDITADDLADNRDDPNMQVDQINFSTITHPDNTASYKIDRKNDMKVNMDKNQSSLLVLPEDLMANVFTKSTAKTPRNLFALCELWDFAGQKEFYATHQAFLTSSAVYLVVADMKDDILSEEDKPKFSEDFQHIGEYIEFWFDSIHCHRAADERASYAHWEPPILLVFTGKDKYSKADFKKRKTELHDEIDKVLGYQSKYHHLHDEFYLSNKKDTDKEFEKLRFAIFETAEKMKNWGKAFPLKWILLEHLIEINKNHGKHFINFTEMIKLAKHPDINIIDEDKLLLFLRFQHNVGNIIFFDNIRDLIILNPQWLADAFRCLVSDRHSILHHLDDWTLFKRQGKISESLITELFESKDGSQFSGQKDNLHKVMEKLDILVKIENSNYIMPSMMPSATFEDLCDKFGILTEKCKRTSWLCFKFEFLPPSFFNHLSAWFIRHYNPSKVDGGSALYRGICMFDIDQSGGTKILVTMSTDTIAIQIVTFSERQAVLEGLCSSIYNEVTQLFINITERYKVKISFKLHFKCSDGYYFQDIFEYEKLTVEKEFFCIQHKQMHRSDQIFSPWMNNEVKEILDRTEINTTQDDKNPENKPSEEDVQDQTSVKTNLPVSVNLRKQLNIKQSTNENLLITSCIKTDNTLVFTDYSNKQLIICNSDGTDIYHIPLSYRPLYITEIDSNTVAVSCSIDITIQIINISTRSITSTINTSGYCEGISYNDNNLYVVIDRSIIRVMDLTGKVIRTIPAPSDRIIDITVHRDRLVCIDETSIYCCSLDGKVMWKFKMDEFQDLCRVTTDDEGNIYVTNEKTNTVLVVSNDGKQHREILTESDGLDRPFGIYFDKKENSLLVCNERDGNAFLFDVIKKLT